MHILLTDRHCDRAKSDTGAQIDFFDTKVSGLALRVSKHGVKAWCFVYTAADGKRARMTLGRYPETGLAAARTMALEAKSDVAEGRDPRSAGKVETLRAICEEYLGRNGSRLRTKDYREATLERLVYPTVGHRPIAEIKRSEIIRLLDRIEDQNGPAMADLTLAFVRTIMNWHASRSDEFRSPIVRGMARTNARERARERTLSDDELRVVWSVADGAGLFGRYLQFLLLTAARRNEAAHMTRAELDGDVWTIPAARMKSGKEHVVPLSATAMGKLPSTGEFMFSRNGRRRISAFSMRKLRFDEAVLAVLRKDDPKAKPLPNWTLHDLRRTACTLMTRAGVPRDHAERCLAHTIGGVHGIYNRHAFFAEKKAAFEKLAGLVGEIVMKKDGFDELRYAV
jgi:integrase